MPEQGMLTYADYVAIPDDGLRRELIAGEIFVMSSPRTRHQRLVLRLAIAFDRHLTEHGGGEVFVAPFDVVLSDHDVVEPDLIFISEAQQSIVTDANVQGVPALLIEVLSEPRHDCIRKRDLYARAGVPEYWIVDPDADRVEVYILEGDRFGRPHVLEPGDTLEYQGLPGLRLDLTLLFAQS